jgi:hypothetical protein
VSEWQGQPEPGSSASSWSKPLERTDVTGEPSWSPRQMAEAMSVGVTRHHRVDPEAVRRAGSSVGRGRSSLGFGAVRYKAMVAQGRIPADTAVSIGSLDAQTVLRAMPQGWARSAHRMVT